MKIEWNLNKKKTSIRIDKYFDISRTNVVGG